MTRFVRRYLLAALPIALCLASPPLRAEDWPQFRGPNRDGKSAEKGLLARWPADGPKLLWSGTGSARASATYQSRTASST